MLMAPGDGALVKWSRSLGIPAFSLPLGSYSNGKKTPRDLLRFAFDVPRMALAVNRVVRRENVDLVYVNGPRALPAVIGLTCPVVFHAHNSVRGQAERRIMRWALRSAKAGIIVASKHVAMGHESSLVIYNGVADLWRGPRNFDGANPRVGFIGRIAPEKGLLDFVRAAHELSRIGVTAEFLIYGKALFGNAAFEREVRSAAEGAPISFCGWTDELARVLGGLDMLAVPSGPDEAATRTIMEAFSAGTPVLAYRAGGIPELVEHNRTGILTETADSAALARNIRRLLEDRATMRRLSLAGREEWNERFRAERFRRSVCDVLERYAQSASEKRPESSAPARGHDETLVSP